MKDVLEVRANYRMNLGPQGGAFRLEQRRDEERMLIQFKHADLSRYVPSSEFNVAVQQFLIVGVQTEVTVVSF